MLKKLNKLINYKLIQGSKAFKGGRNNTGQITVRHRVVYYDVIIF